MGTNYTVQGIEQNVREAFRLTNAKTPQEVLTLALQALARDRQILSLRDLAG